MDDNNQVITENDDNEIELEIVDDTPPQDRARPPLSKEKLAAAEPSDDELASYSENVQKRIKQMKHALHDQRRTAEAAEREREAAVQYAQAMKQQAEALQQRYSAGEKVFVTGMQDKAKVSIQAARDKLKAATEAFDADAIADATLEMNRAVMEEQKYLAWPSQNAGQTENSGVQTRQTEPPRSPTVPKPDARAMEWAAKNDWFEVDKAMTGFAYGVDAELAARGITAASNPDGYYGEIDRRLRETFPSKFEDEDPPQRQQPAKQEPPRSTVAPVRRSASGKRVVTLTKSQESMAKRLGLTAAQYASSLVELENRNG
jgi:hypothetical protein